MCSPTNSFATIHSTPAQQSIEVECSSTGDKCAIQTTDSEPVIALCTSHIGFERAQKYMRFIIENRIKIEFREFECFQNLNYWYVF
jgi:hypothetical protein